MGTQLYVSDQQPEEGQSAEKGRRWAPDLWAAHRGVLALLLLMVSLATPTTTHAAFPGANGQIAVTQGACTVASFSGQTNFGAGSFPAGVAVGDFNGDGELDLAVSNAGSNDVSILLGTGTGSFGAATNFPVGASPISVAVGDFNGDGKLDLAVSNAQSDSVSILLGDGNGGFGAAANFAAGSQPFTVAVGDLNGDGKLDLATANHNSTNVSILLGDGTGSFGAATNFEVGPNPMGVAVGDFNGDGKLDLAVANEYSTTISILLGTGTGSFGAATNFEAGIGPISIAARDFNGDGKLDLAVSNTSVASNNVSIFLGDGTGSFGAPTNFPVGTSPSSIVAGDFNGDGKLDLAVGVAGNSSIAILLGDGTGGFGAPANFAAGIVYYSKGVAVGDFNGDGKLDLAVVNGPSDNVSVLLNNCSPPIAATFYLHGSGATANPPTLFLNSVTPTSATEKYRDSASVKFSGGNTWQDIGIWAAAPGLTVGQLTSLNDLHVWLGLKNSDDIGTRFDLRAEVYRSGVLVTAGESDCITAVTRNPDQAKEVVTPFGAFAPVNFDGAADNLSLKIRVRIGTNGAGAFCGGHSNAVGARLYFDSVSRAARFGAP